MVNLFLKNKNNIQRFAMFMNSPAGGKWVSYGRGSRMILNFCQSAYAREVYFSDRLQLLDEFLKNIPEPPQREALLPAILVNNFLRSWRSIAISRMKMKEVEQYFRIEGLEKFDRAYRDGKGVILLNSHWGYAECSLSLFPLLGYKNFHTIVRERGSASLKFSGLKDEMKPNMIIFRDHSNAELFKTLFMARDVLNEGGIFHILGDGYHGKSSINFNFLGRIRGFRASFAELGLSTDAPIIPVFISVLPDGHIRVRFEDELDKGSEQQDHQARVVHIVEQYAAKLESRWKEEPQNISWGFMEKFLRQVNTDLE